MKVYQYIAILLIFLLSTPYSQAQESEEDLNKKALELFEQENYEAAFKIYSTLLSIQMQSPEYNYRFGACQLFTAQDKEEPLKYLKFAVENPSAPALAHFYYGLGLHLNYQFDKAIGEYKKYVPASSKKEKESALVAHYIEQCEHGKTLISSFTDISVIQRSVLPRSDFYRNYDLTEFGGKIIVKPEDFMSEEDKKRDASFLMYFQQEAELIYYASYSEKNATGKDLYVIQKLPGGGWSTPKRLSDEINTPFDEDYPFIHPEGNMLYFASKGHNSMGGYDIFKSERRGDGSWTKPINMEFAINTPWDEFMFISDIEENSAWFASNRETNYKQVTVYRIGIERIPLDLTLIKGSFEAEGSKKATITVEDMIQNKVVGVYESERQLGGYLLDLKGSGKYKFIVEAEESSSIHTRIVEVPREKGLKQFRQEMILASIDGKEQLQIINHFDEPIEDEQLLTADILRKQASLSVNSSEEDLVRTVEIVGAGTSQDKNSNPSGLSEEERIVLAEKAVNALKEEGSTMDKKVAALYEIIQENISSDDPADLAKAAIAAELAGIYKDDAERRQVAVERMEGTLSALKSGALDETAFNAQYAQLAATQNNFKPLEKFESQIASDFEKRMDPTLSEFESKNQEVQSLESDITAIDEEIAYYNTEIENSKDELIKEELQLQIDEAQASRPQKIASLERAKKEFKALETQKANAKRYLDLSTTLLALATQQAPQMTNVVSSSAINEVQNVLNKRAESDPALMAFVQPEKSGEALAQNLSENRKADTGEKDSNGNAGSSSTSSTNSNSNTTGANQSVNDEIRSIAAQESKPEIIQGDYDAHFQDELSMASNAEDPIIAESRKAELYDQWAENIQVRIDSVENVKSNTSDAVSLAQLDALMMTLKQDKEEKEELAMTSYERIASLSDEAASRGTSGGNSQSTASDNTNSTPPVTQALLESDGFPPAVEDINDNYAPQIESLAQKAEASNSSEDILALAGGYDNWANELQNEMNVLARQIEAAESAETKSILQAKASDVSQLRLEKIAKATELKQEASGKEDAIASAASQSELQAQLFEFVENYNSNAFQQIQNQIDIIHDDNLKRAQSVTLNKNWMIGIQNEKVKTEARIANTNDPKLINELQSQLALLNAEKEAVQTRLDSLNVDQSVASGPSAPSSVFVKGSERFEGYIPVESPVIEEYTADAEKSTSLQEDINDEVNSLETQLAETKKKKAKVELEKQIAQKESEQRVIKMESAFYTEAAQKLASVETQVLTMEVGDMLPSEKQAQKAASVQAEATQLTSEAVAALDAAEAIKKKKTRLAAIEQAMVLQNDAALKRKESDLNEALVAEMQAIENATIAKNFIILPMQEVVLPVTNKTLNPNEVADIKATTEYAFYQGEKAKTDSIRTEINRLESLEKQYTNRGKFLMEQSASTPLGAGGSQARLELANQAYADFERADSISENVARLKREATYIENEANRSLLTLPEEAYMNILAYYNNPEGKESVVDPTPQESIAALPTASRTTNTSDNPFDDEKAFRLNAPVAEDNSSLIVEPDYLTNTIFELEETAPTSVYNDRNPIPVDPPLPTGLLYKVQIGAFRNAIKQDAFKGIAPIVGESTNSGFTRYSAGEFNTFSSADAAKVKIQGIGYADAFVVAYLNGKRISINDAKTAEAGGQISQPAGAGIASNSTARGANNAVPVGPQPGFKPSIIKQGSIEINAIENMSGTFFTVQVGVFSKPVSAAAIYNITPLNQENLPNGTYRYTTGKFDNENIATKARDEARALGVSDAFVTAYKDGVRVAVEVARGNTQVAPTPTPAPIPVPAPAAAPQPKVSSTYKILLGTFVGEIPLIEATQILSLSAQGVDKVNNPDGSCSYYFGSFTDQSAANAKAAELRSVGLTQAKSVGQ